MEHLLGVPASSLRLASYYSVASVFTVSLTIIVDRVYLQFERVTGRHVRVL